MSACVPLCMYSCCDNVSWNLYEYMNMDMDSIGGAWQRLKSDLAAVLVGSIHGHLVYTRCLCSIPPSGQPSSASRTAWPTRHRWPDVLSPVCKAAECRLSFSRLDAKLTDWLAAEAALTSYSSTACIDGSHQCIAWRVRRLYEVNYMEGIPSLAFWWQEASLATQRGTR